MDVQRAILLFALAFVLIVLYQRWLEHQTPVMPPSQQVAGEQSPAAGSEDLPDTPDTPAVPAAASDTGAAPEAPGQADDGQGSGERLQVSTDLMRLEIDPLGGIIRELQLLDHPVSVDQPDSPFALMKQRTTDKGDEILLPQSGLIGKDRPLPNHKTQYNAEGVRFRLQDGEDELTVDLTWTAPDGVFYTKRFTFFRNQYEIKIDYLVDNRSTEPWSGFIYGQFLSTYTPPERSFVLGAVPTYMGGAIYSPTEKFEKISFDDMRDGPLKRQISGGWAAMLQHYFVAAWFPRDDSAYAFYTRVHENPANTRFNLGLNALAPVNVAPGETGQLGLDLFAGPKEQDRLAQKSEGFDLTVDYGWLTPVSAPLFWVLDKIHTFTGNWGWSIIILTFFIKLAFYPLSATSYKSMAKMKKLQPRLQTLKERYGDDKAKMNQAMMEIYKKEKVNPLGGCLPIVIQIPVFIALYWVLLESVELRQAPWELWIKDLSVRDPYFVLPILMGASMVAQQMLNPAPLDPMQKKIMMALPVVFTFIFLYFPAGLVLYWLVNNVLSITQQWYINKYVVG